MSNTIKPNEQTIPDVSTLLYETIQMLGDGVTYSGCDGITRFRFNSMPTANITKMVSVIRTSFTTITPRSLINRLYSLHARSPACSATGISKIAIMKNASTSFATKCSYLMSGEVVLLYWPPKTSANTGCTTNQHHRRDIPSALPSALHSNIFITSAITFQGQDLYLRGIVKDGVTPKWKSGAYIDSSVLTGPFTFTSPTVYIAHHPISAGFVRYVRENPRNQTIFTRELKSAGIIGLKADQISTIRQLPGHNATVPPNYAQLVAQGKYLNTRPTLLTQTILPLDYENLMDPVPASVYYDGRYEDCWGQQSHCATITDNHYRPRLVFLQRYLETAELGLSGVRCATPMIIDPPIALTPLMTRCKPDALRKT
jgi:hypothetical protein